MAYHTRADALAKVFVIMIMMNFGKVLRNLINVTIFRPIVLKAKLVSKISTTIRNNIFVNCLTIMPLMKLNNNNNNNNNNTLI